MLFKDSLRLDSVERARIAERIAHRQKAAIKAGESDCLASTVSDKTCLATVGILNQRIHSSTGKTNGYASGGENPASIALLRESLLQEALSDAFASFLFDGKIANPYIEEVESEWRERMNRSEEKIGEQTLDDDGPANLQPQALLWITAPTLLKVRAYSSTYNTADFMVYSTITGSGSAAACKALDADRPFFNGATGIIERGSTSAD